MFSGENSLDGLRTPNTKLSKCKQCELSLKEDVIMSYAIYLRKSRADAEAEARREGETLARHERALKELAVRNDYPIAQIYRYIVSGESISNRPQMRQRCGRISRCRHAGGEKQDFAQCRQPRGSTRPSREIKKAAVAFSATAALSSCFHLLFMILLYRDVRATINYLP